MIKFHGTNTIKNIFVAVTGVGTSEDNLNLPSYASMWTVAFPTGPITAHSSHSPHVASPSCDVIILPARTARSARPLIDSRTFPLPTSKGGSQFLPSFLRLFLFRIFLRLDPILPIPISRTQSSLGFRVSMVVELGFCADLGFHWF
ncbi:hypothetical protein VNO80_19542 [Phaseolus coccineus]|uniref:Uncharacterized protein n=1 Tax=Phaseolus coccineus TaxID=3886 RepID=A0AAN9MG82_PHACN